MRFFRDIPLNRKLTMISMATSCVALLLTCGVIVAFQWVNTRRALVNQGLITAQMVGDNSAAALAFEDPESAALTLRSLSADKHVTAAFIYDVGGQVFSSFQPRGAAPLDPPAVGHNLYRFHQGHFEVFRDITAAGETVGTVYVRHDMDELHETLKRSGLLSLAILVTASLVAYLLSAKLQPLVASPIIGLARIVRDVAKTKDFSVRAVKNGDDEVGRLIEGFNDMLSQLQQRDAALQAAQDSLERRVSERTAELAGSLSLLNATLDSTADGILAVRLSGEVLCFNTQFATMWGLPEEVLQKKQSAAIMQWVVSQVRDPQSYQDRIEQLRESTDQEATEVIELADGRSFERYVKPQRLDGQIVGVVINFRDITAHKRAAEALRKEQELLGAIFENVADGIVSCDAQGFLTLFNRATREIHGEKVEKLPADKWAECFDLYLPDGRTRMTTEQVPLYRALTEGSVRDVEMVIAPKHGRSRRVLVSGRAFYDAAGMKAGAVIAMHDITERRQDEERLKESHERFRQLADNISDVFWIRSADFQTVQYLSTGYDEIWDRPAEALYREPHLWVEAIHPEDRQSALSIMRALSGDASEVSVEYRIVRPDGTIRWIHDRGFQARDAAGDLVRLTGIASDITERKQAEIELGSVHRQLLETSRQAGMAEVATGVLHNVGNVLNSVNVSATLVTENVKRSKIGNLDRVVALLDRHAADLGAYMTHDPQGKNLPDFLRQLHQRLSAEQRGILHELESLRQNIEHIKDIVSMQQEYAKVSGVTEVLNVTDLVEDSLRMNSAALARHGVIVEREFQDVPPIAIEKHKALQVLVNLIRNAKYACDESGRTEKRLTMRVATSEGRVRISVSDNGVGIPAENLTRIFHHGFTTRKEGHGFGLHSGALAATEMGGALRVHSDGPGQGATFILELPAPASEAVPA